MRIEWIFDEGQHISHSRSKACIRRLFSTADKLVIRQESGWERCRDLAGPLRERFAGEPGATSGSMQIAFDWPGNHLA